MMMLKCKTSAMSSTQFLSSFDTTPFTFQNHHHTELPNKMTTGKTASTAFSISFFASPTSSPFSSLSSVSSSFSNNPSPLKTQKLSGSLPILSWVDQQQQKQHHADHQAMAIRQSGIDNLNHLAGSLPDLTLLDSLTVMKSSPNNSNPQTAEQPIQDEKECSLEETLEKCECSIINDVLCETNNNTPSQHPIINGEQVENNQKFDDDHQTILDERKEISDSSLVKPVRRKSNTMIPVLPDFELMAKLRQQDEEQQKENKTSSNQNQIDERCSMFHGFDDSSPVLAQNENAHQQMNSQMHSKASPTGFQAEIGCYPNTPHPHLSQCGFSYTERETAAAWLASATSQLSSHSKDDSIDALTEHPGAFSLDKILSQIEQTGEHDQSSSVVDDANNHHHQNNQNNPIRKRSILRSNSINVASLVKKSVRFADSLGFQLEDVRYFCQNAQKNINRRFSSTTSILTSVHCSEWNNYWNIDNWNNCFHHRASLNGTGGNQTNNQEQKKSILKSDDNNRFNNEILTASNGYSVRLNYNKRLAQRNVRPVSSHFVRKLFVEPGSDPTNFVERIRFDKICLESCLISGPLGPTGTHKFGITCVARVMNVCFEKQVFLRYTCDEWATWIDIPATYMINSNDGFSDRFSMSFEYSFDSQPQHHFNPTSFNQNSSSTNGYRLVFALRFIANRNQEFWDNNSGKNYTLAYQ